MLQTKEYFHQEIEQEPKEKTILTSTTKMLYQIEIAIMKKKMLKLKNLKIIENSQKNKHLNVTLLKLITMLI